MRTLSAVCVVAFAALWTMPQALAQVVDFKSDDAEMNAAIDEARRTLPDFLGRTDTLGQGNWFLKIAVPTDKADIKFEHIWMANCRSPAPEEFDCLVSNVPVHVPLAKGQPFRFGVKDISDWMYLDSGGRIHGAYTMRVIVTRLPADQAQPLIEQLAPLE